MNNFEPEQGDMILVSKVGLSSYEQKEFVVKSGGAYYCKTGDNRDLYLVAWFAAKPLPAKPEPVPYNHETWPKQVVWTKSALSMQLPAMVTGFTDTGIYCGGISYNFGDIVGGRLMSLDHCATWQPCHDVLEKL